MTDKRELNKKLKSEYELNKQRLLLMERENFSHIMVIKTQDGWYKVLNHSAILYLHYVTPIAQKKFDENFHPPKLLADTDFRYKSPIGVLSFKTLDVLKDVMKTCGFEREPVEGSKWIISFKLDRELDKNEFWDLVKTEKALWDKINKTITPDVSFPDLGIDIQETTKLFYDVVRKLPRDARELIGYNMIELLRRLSTGLICAEKNYVSWKQFFESAPRLITELQADISTMSTTRLLDKRLLLRMAELVDKIEKDLIRAKKIYAKTCE